MVYNVPGDCVSDRSSDCQNPDYGEYHGLEVMGVLWVSKAWFVYISS
jgi:hypothetical protein